jgi:hypothetical protein
MKVAGKHWKSIVPLDKDLRANLAWRWQREYWRRGPLAMAERGGTDAF